MTGAIPIRDEADELVRLAIPSEVAAVALAVLADSKTVQTTLTGFSTLAALRRAEEAAARVVAEMRGLRLQIRGRIASAEMEQRKAARRPNLDEHNAAVVARRTEAQGR